jgi:ribonuclease J
MLLTVHRGTHEIGGSCVELATGDTRLILDAGLPLVTATRERFDARALRGKSRAELRASGILPPVRGLFSSDGAPPAALLFSHVHLDHTGLLPYIQPEVPVVLSKGTSKLREWKLPGGVWRAAFAPDGRHLATVNRNGTLYILRLTP